MPEIPKTLIATSYPVDICKGFALFPKIGTARAGVSLGSTKSPLITVPQQIALTFRFSLDVFTSFFMGICGPAYGIAFFAEGSCDQDALALEVTDDTTAAGLFYGANLTISFGATLDILHIRWVSDGWKSRVEEKWVAALNASFDTTIDIVGLVLEFILGKLSKGNDRKARLVNGISSVGEALPNLLASYSIYAEESEALAEAQGKVTVSPSVDLPINIIALIRKIPAVGPIIAAIEKAGLYLSLGPSFSLVVPMDIGITSWSVDGARYDNGIGWDSDGNMVAGYTSGTVPASPQQISVNLRHTPGTRFEYKLGFFISLNAFKIFNTGATFSIGVPDLLGLKPNFGTYDNTLSAKVGKTTAGFDPLRAPFDGDDEIEVVFEPLGEPA